MKDKLSKLINKKIDILVKRHLVGSSQQAGGGASLFAEHSHQRDIFIKASGMSTFYKLFDEVYYSLHPKLKVPLIDVWGKKVLRKELDDLIRRKRRNTKTVVNKLLKSNLPKWNVFYHLVNISLNFDIDLGVAKLYAPGASFYKGRRNYLSQNGNLQNFPFIEVKNYTAANEDVAAERAIEVAKFALSIVPSGSVSLILKPAPTPTDTSIIVNRAGSNTWQIIGSIGHRGVTFNSSQAYEVKRAKVVSTQAAKMSHRLKENSKVSKRVKEASIMFQTAKTTTDGPSKLLLLVSCLDALLMEKFHKGVHSNTFNKRLMKYIQKHHKFSNKDSKFFSNIYDTRSKIVHAGGRGIIRLEEFNNTEVVVYSLLLQFNQYKGKSQLQVLKKLGIV